MIVTVAAERERKRKRRNPFVFSEKSHFASLTIAVTGVHLLSGECTANLAPIDLAGWVFSSES